MPYTLLLADDSVTIQRVIELTFADEDVQVVAVSDGEQAIAVLNERPPDIVLADIGMPNQNGYDVAQHIRITPALAHIPIVLLTGAFEPVDEARAAMVGVDAVLAKPFEPRLVITKVKELLARPRRDLASVEPASSTPFELSAALPEPVEPIGPPTVPSAATPAADDYFDRLDEAFASLADGPSRQLKDVPQPAVEDARPDVEGTPTTEAGLGFAAADAAAELEAPVSGTQFPTLSDAFAALLDAEHAAPIPEARPIWPSPPGAARTAAIAPDALVERVTHDVLQRLADHAVKEAVADIVLSVAERMVRDEIDRIKASIRS